jgi:hypothetical protein
MMVLLGVWVVRYREVQKVAGFGKGGTRKGGGGGGTGADGGGSYEMVEQGETAGRARGDDNV